MLFLRSTSNMRYNRLVSLFGYESVLSMTEALSSSSATTPLATLHLISYLNWEREGAKSFELSRMELLDILDVLVDKHLTPSLPMQPTRDETLMRRSVGVLLLGGQTIILEDIAQVRPALVENILQKNLQQKTVYVGPFYVQVDGILNSGEALIRDLLMGQDSLQRHHLKRPRVAYFARTAQYGSQFPQILRGFGIDAVIFVFNENMMPLPFRWESPDGSQVLVTHYRPHNTLEESIQHQRNSQPDGPFIWMHPFNSEHPEPPNHPLPSGIIAYQATPEAFTKDLRENLPDHLRPALRGEAHLLDNAYRSGRFSARQHLKHANARLQAALIHRVEPLLALASTHGKAKFDSNTRALLAHAWRQLLQSQTPEAVGGLGVDEVEQATLSRHQQVDSLSDALIKRGMDAFNSINENKAPTRNSNPLRQTYLVVWNWHGTRVKGVVSQTLRLPLQKTPQTLYDPNGEPIPFAWNEETQTISFRADVLGMGYRTYTLDIGEQTLGEGKRTLRKKETFIQQSENIRLSVDNDRLSWSWGRGTIDDLLSFYDNGDNGTAEAYAPPIEDVIVKATLMDNVYSEITPISQQLVLHHQLQIAPNLENGKRPKGLRPLDIVTRATFYDDMGGLHLQISGVNNARDHRLRAHINSGKRAEKVWVGAPFTLSERRAHLTQVMQGVIALQDNAGTLAIYSDSTPVYEAIAHANQTHIALTLLRAVGYADKGRTIKAEGAQSQRAYQNGLWLHQTPSLNPANLLRTAQTTHAPLYAQQVETHPIDGEQSFLALDGDNVVMTVLKSPQNDKGWLIRLLNPTANPTEATLRPLGRLNEARYLNLDETPLNDGSSPTVQGNVISVKLNPHEIKTLHLTFE